MATLNNDLVAKETDTLLYDDIYIAIIVLLLVVLFSFFMSRYLLSPLNRLGVLSGESDPSRIAAVQSVPSYGIHEVDQLQIAFNSMMERIETLVEESYLASKKQLRLEYEKRDTEILALQAQIHPHFLYNTLEKIVNLVESDEKERAVDMIGLLSRLFRYSISQPTVKVTVMEELSYARTYVTLMSYRFKDRISCSWHMDEGARNSHVIKLLLQPILENVFQHATQGNTDVVQVDVACRDLVSQIEISVTDNGPGMSDRQLEELKMNISQNSHHRIGLANVNSRIRLHYGQSYGLDITSRTDYGTVVRIVIPKLLKSD
ncbi:putative sensor-like histidine kinase [compost metagenome]